MIANQSVRIACQDDGGGEEEEHDSLMGGGNMELMDEETRNWYQGHRSDILRAASTVLRRLRRSYLASHRLPASALTPTSLLRHRLRSRFSHGV
ncbi:hypothetical protein QYE76_028798 [Lolium multiflorum]|uniref:Uncharacterized protein n=1 Tax=Lolium multiflorum TaxID=4521 RepID=A0AAD8QMM0_LOLMU|nr:hypothetical protein QYE76_028798 [Lolium multiflorum]